MAMLLGRWSPSSSPTAAGSKRSWEFDAVDGREPVLVPVQNAHVHALGADTSWHDCVDAISDLFQLAPR